jgi:hypothetical protein
MELSVRYYYVSVRYDKFIKRRFRSLRIAYEDNQAGLLKKQCIIQVRILLFGEIYEGSWGIFDYRFSIDYLLQEIIDSGIRIERKCGVGEI